MNLGTGTRRREFIAALGSAAATAIWPLAGRTQQNQLRRVGILMAYSEGDREGQSFITTFRGALAKLGWTEGRNVQIETCPTPSAAASCRTLRDRTATPPGSSPWTSN